MAGDDDMSRDEMVARIALLEGLVYGLIEQRALQLGENGGIDAVTPFVEEMGRLVGDRTANMADEQKDFARRQFGAILQVLQDRLLPKSQGVTVN